MDLIIHRIIEQVGWKGPQDVIHCIYVWEQDSIWINIKKKKLKTRVILNFLYDSRVHASNEGDTW